jgi:hypothetical protein
MSYADFTTPHGGTAQADCLFTAAFTPLHHLQGFAVLIGHRSVRPNLSKEERNQFLLQDLTVDIATVTDELMIPSTQPLQLVLLLSSLARLPWTSSKLQRCAGL